jgi:dTDP-4-amino-4,6-dideoxygalactose transaminase
VLEAAVKARVKKVVAASSASVYGMAEEFPTNEHHHPYGNRTLYGAAKAFNESLFRSFHDMYGLNYVALRYFNVYGSRMDIHGAYTEVLIRWMERIAAGLPPLVFGDGTQTMDFISVEDVARANILAAESTVNDEVFNIASGVETSLNELLATLLKVMGSSLLPEHVAERKINPVPRRLADTRKAEQLIGFRTQIPLSEGLATLVSWWTEQGAARKVQGIDEKGPQQIPIAKPFVGEREIEAVSRPLLSGWITQGPEVARFEKEFSTYVGAKYACAVCNCTTALHLALLAVGVRPGDEVITVSHSFIATANSIRYCGATPVFVDIESDTFNINPALIEKRINHRTRALLCVHQMGMPCDLEQIIAIARRHKLPVVEDAACAVGSEILWDGNWEKIGKPHGAVACFSFHPRKLLTTGDGGVITTSNAEWDKQFRLWRQHSMSISDTARHEAKDVMFESYLELGYNYRLTDIQAAVGREQLKRLPEMVERRRYLVRRYTELAGDIPGLSLPKEPAWARSNWQSYCVRLPEWCEQREVMRKMLDGGITTRPGIICAHREPAYQTQQWLCGEGCAAGSCKHLIESEKAQRHSILLPLFHQITEEEQSRVVDALRRACSR